jgi:4-hydroxy-4-methyl-2-oxoglutarate aldolase
MSSEEEGEADVRIHPGKDDLEELTGAWTGERFGSGRPRVPDEVLASLKLATTEEAWGHLFQAGYVRQFAGDWRETHPGTVIVGRAVTAQFLPHRPDLDAVVVAAGAREGRMEGDRQNSWVIETLENGDIMVVDIFGKIVEGTVVGDNLGTAVASRTGVGAVIDGGIRDLQGLQQLPGGVNIFHRAVDPTPIRGVTLAGINIPIRIGGATVLPGDVILGTPTGIAVIPAHLAEAVAATSEDTRVRDVFGKQALAERRYTSAQIDVPTWADDIEADFQQWRKENA